MRGRKPLPLRLGPDEAPIWQPIARRRSLPWSQSQRARIVLGGAAGAPIQLRAIRTQCDRTTIGRTGRRAEDAGRPGLRARPQRTGRPARIAPLQRAQIVPLACREPVAPGRHITHWSSKDRARQAVEDGSGSALSARSIRTLLNEVDLQPHRTRYWKTARWDAEFKQRAEKILWGYANAERLVHNGRMEAAGVAAKDARPYVEELAKFRRRHRHLRGAYRIHDGDPSHTAAAREDDLGGCGGGWRSRFTPVPASWRDQAELLLDAFADRSLKRGSWCSRADFGAPGEHAWPEDNRLDAHPFEGTWTNPKMRRWFADHEP